MNEELNLIFYWFHHLIVYYYFWRWSFTITWFIFYIYW